MNPEERVSILQCGLTAVRKLESERRAMLPPPVREDPSLLREIRELAGLVDRLELELDLEGFDLDTIYSRDASLSMGFDEADIALLQAWAAGRGPSKSYHAGAPSEEQRAALQALGALLARYISGEFMPPDSFFGIRAPEA